MKNDIEALLDRRLAHLKIESLCAGYGPFLVLRDLTLEARPGLTVILGPNGAGKTTLLKSIAGLIPRGGVLRLDDEEIEPEAKTSDIVRRGIALVPEGRQLFPQMTVAENLELGGWLLGPDERAKRLEQAFEDFPKLRERATQLAGTMSGGEQQMVAVARAMMSAPRLLMLDEPSLGLAPLIIDDIFQAVRQLNRETGLSILFVEQNAKLALEVAEYAYIMENGRIVLDGEAEVLAKNSDIQEFYLGQSADGQRKSLRELKHYKRRKRWLS